MVKLQYVQGNPYFTDKNKNYKQYNYLTENLNTDIVIIGGGITGAILTYYFTTAGVNCVLLEKNRVAHGSTSITTSLLQYELDSNALALEEYNSVENTIKAYKLGLKALTELDNFINIYGNKCNYKKRDTLLYSSKNLDIKELYKEYKLRKKHGFDVKYYDENDNPYPFDLKAGILSINGGAEVDPYLLTHNLLEYSCNTGKLKVYENSEVLNIEYKDNQVEINTLYNYKVNAKKVILATGYDTDRFTNTKFGTKTCTYNIVTNQILNLNACYKGTLIRDNKETYNYYRTTFDNRIIAGGEDTEFSTNINKENVASEKYNILEQKIKTIFPCAKNCEINYRYCGAFTSTNDDLGFIGPDIKHKNLWLCLGYGANGILFAFLGAVMLSQLYLGNKNSNMNLFKVDRFIR